METLLHIEDDSLWRAVLQKVVEGTKGVSYVGYARTCQEALASCQALAPTMIVLDIYLPDGSAIELISALAELEPQPKILLLTIAMNDALLLQLARPCVCGMVWKSTYAPGEIERAVQAMVEGKCYLPEPIKTAERRLRAQQGAFFKILSDAEMRLVPLFGAGYTDAEIAEKTGGNQRTVKSHRQHIMSKLGLHRSEELIRWATGIGLGLSPRIADVAEEERP